MMPRWLRTVLLLAIAFSVACESGDDPAPSAVRTRRPVPAPSAELTIAPDSSTLGYSARPTVVTASLPFVVNSNVVWVARGRDSATVVTGTPGGYGDLHWVGDGAIAFRGVAAGGSDFLTWDGDSVSATASVADDRYAWSHDGKRLAYIPAESPGDLSVLNLETGRSQTVARGLIGPLAPLWSPDDVRLAYTAGVTTSPGVFLVNSEGGPDRLVSPAEGTDLALGWSPNGRFILFLRTIADGTASLHLAEWDQTKDILLSEVAPPEASAAASYATWSPSGRFVAWSTGPTGSVGQTFVLDTATMESYQVGDAAYDLAWSPNSAWLAVVRPDGIALRPSDNSDPRLVTEISGEVAWAPDSNSFAVTAGDGTSAIVEAGTGAAAPLAAGRAGMSWAPDSQAIAVSGPDGVVLAGRDGSTIRSLSDVPSPFLVWSPDGTALAFCLGGAAATFDVATGKTATIRDTACDSTPGWSPDSTQLAGTRSAGPAAGHVVIESDAGQIWSYPSALTGALAWAPDFQTAAFLADDADGGLFLVSADGETVTTLETSVATAEWSPSGDALAWMTTGGAVRVAKPPDAAPVTITTTGARAIRWCEEGTAVAVAAGDALLVARDGQPLVSVPAPPGVSFEAPPAWGGCEFLVTQGSASGESADLFLLRQDTVTRLTATQEREISPSLSPDGAFIAFRRVLASGLEELVVQSVNGTGAPLIVEKRPEAGNARPRWIDGTHVSYAGTDGLHVLDADSGESPLILAGAEDGWPIDGGRLLVFGPGGIAAIGPGGSGRVELVRALPCQRFSLEGLSRDASQFGLAVLTIPGCR